LTSDPDALRHLNRRSRIGLSAGKTSTLSIGTAFALLNPKKRITPPVSAPELAATHISSVRGLFFAYENRCRGQASNLQGNGPKQAIFSIYPLNKF
jgi:hypothetical protein